MPRPLTITTTIAGKPATKIILPSQVSAVYQTREHDAVACVQHGEFGRVYLSASECVDVIRLHPVEKCWQDRKGGCYASRQTEIIPPKCIGCQLRKILCDATGDDLRQVPRVRRDNSVKTAICVGAAMLGLSMWFGQIGQRAYAERDREHALRVRAETELRQMRRGKMK